MLKSQLCVVILLFIVTTKGYKSEPNVMVVMLIRNKAHLLNNTLKFLENQDYPKAKIGLFIRSDHNEDNTDEILATWLKSQKEYYFMDVSIGNNYGQRFHDQLLGPLEWSISRFKHIIALKEEALVKARQQVWTDWIWYLDADAFITNSSTLRSIF